MSTPNPMPQFRPLTPKDMEEYEKELKASLANTDSQDENTPNPADPEVPPPAAKVELTKEEYDRIKAYEKRFSDQTTYLNEQIRLRKEAEKAKEDLLKQSTRKAYASDDEVAEFEAKVETTPIIKELIRRQAEELQKEAERKLEEKLTTKEAEARKAAEDATKLSKAHPDWTSYDVGGEVHEIFTGWLEKQAATIQRLANYTETKDIDGAIAVLNMFKAEVQVKRPSGPKNKQPATTNPASRSQAEMPKQNEGAFDVIAWNTAFEQALKSANKPLQNKLMEEMQKARKEGRLTSY